MTPDADVTSGEPVTTAEQPLAAEPDGARDRVDPPMGSGPASRQQAWSMPKSPVTRKHIDDLGRAALTIAGSLARFAANTARSGAHTTRRMWRALAAVPPAARLLFVAGPLMLFGIAGALALDNTLALLCTVVVVPVCAGILGALGYRWFIGLGIDTAGQTPSRPAQPADSDLQRSVQYVDRKLALALTSFGTEHHQQAVIALFQAKTAVELTLGTEQDLASYADMTLRPDDYGLRPRIRAGSGSTSAPRESNSLAAS